MKKFISILILSFLLFSCKKTEEKSTEEKTDHSIKKNPEDSTSANEKSELSSDFPKTGKKFTDFVPDNFELQYEAEGDLNNDGVSDAALVVRKKEDSLGDRTCLILLRHPDKSYRLDKISNTVFPMEYTDSHYKIYDTEAISISKGELNIQLYATGPNGNLFSKFKYIGKNLLLTYIETYNVGAGSHQALNYEVMKGIFKQEIINTMEEEMPSETKTLHLKKERFPFENVSPEEVIQNAYKNLEGKLDY